MVNSNFVQLGEISEAIRGVTFSGGEAVPDAFENSVACLTTSGVQEVVNWDSRRFIPRNRLANSKQLLQEGDVLISTANSKELVGKSCIVDRLPYEATFGAFVTVIRPNKKVTPEYLAFWMRTKEFLDKCYLMSSNTTNISNLRTSELLEFQIPLPPLTEQKRIASLLRRADRLRHLRRTAHDLGESLLQSVFLEMFGDPVENTKHWQRYELGEVASVERGRFSPRPRNDPKYYGGKYPFIQTGDISASGGIVTQYSQTLNELGIKVSKAFDIGTIVIAIVGATIGESAILGIKTYCPDSIIGITPNPKKCNSQYLEFVMRHWKPVFRAQAPETARANINIGIVKPIPIPVPPLSLQEEFAGVVARVESLRGRMSEGERQVEGLFESLLAEAFN